MCKGLLLVNGLFVSYGTLLAQASCHLMTMLHTWVCVNPSMPNDPYSGHTTPLTSKRCILYIYSTNIGTEYFKHGIYGPFFLFKMQFVS